jgi:hypothetical protein
MTMENVPSVARHEVSHGRFPGFLFFEQCWRTYISVKKTVPVVAGVLKTVQENALLEA